MCWDFVRTIHLRLSSYLSVVWDFAQLWSRPRSSSWKRAPAGLKPPSGSLHKVTIIWLRILFQALTTTMWEITAHSSPQFCSSYLPVTVQGRASTLLSELLPAGDPSRPCLVDASGWLEAAAAVLCCQRAKLWQCWCVLVPVGREQM